MLKVHGYRILNDVDRVFYLWIGNHSIEISSDLVRQLVIAFPLVEHHEGFGVLDF